MTVLRTALTLVLMGIAAPCMAAAQEETVVAQTEVGDPYVAGDRLRDSGDWRRALDVWEAAWDSMSFEGAYDPRIGIAYIETATENSFEAAYERASEMYLWGVADPDLERYADVLEEEVARIEPLLPEDERGRLTKLFDARDPRLGFELKRFWVEADPTPITRHNERLIEHWERIAYARDQYSNGRYTVYDTDDRGEYYVRYGPPQKREAGMLGSREDELQYWISDLDQRNALRRYDKHPTFEVWVYEELNDEELVYLLFGQEDGAGRFKLVDGPGDLVPPEAFSTASRRYTPGGIKAGFFLELFYYSELASIGGPYGERFGELDRAWHAQESRAMRGGVDVAPPPESELETYKDRFDQEDRYFKTWVPEIPARSEYDGLTPRYNLRTWAFRSLSPENEPRITVVALTAPRVDVERAGQVRGELDDPAQPPLTHTLIVRDHRLDEIGRVSSVASSVRGDISIFPLRHVDGRLHYTIVTERQMESRLEGPDQLPDRAYLHDLEPLDPDPSRLAVSDLMLGVPPWPGIDTNILPFPLVPSRRIWTGEALRAYLEVYHLVADEEERIHGFTTQFVVRALDDAGEPISSPEPVRLSVDLESPGSMSQGTFDIDTRTLPQGRYRLDVVIRDRVSGEERVRTSEFEIIGR